MVFGTRLRYVEAPYCGTKTCAIVERTFLRLKHPVQTRRLYLCKLTLLGICQLT